MVISTTSRFCNIAVLAAALLVVLSSTVYAAIEDPELHLHNWPEAAGGEKKRILIKYFEPYCPYSIAFQEKVWSKLEKKYKDDPDIKLVEVNCGSKWGLQACIEHDTEHTPELHYGDVSHTEKYDGSGNYEDLVEFIETKLRKPMCTLVTPEGCPEEERKGMAEIEKLTLEYFEKLNAFSKANKGEIENPQRFAAQAILKFGGKNPFKNDYDNVIADEDYHRPVLMFDGRPTEE